MRCCATHIWFGLSIFAACNCCAILAFCRRLDIKFPKLVRTIVRPPGGINWVAPMAWSPSWVECTRIGRCRTSWCQIMVPEMLHCQPFRRPMVETCPRVDCRTEDKDWKTNKDMGWANTNVLPVVKFGRIDCNRNAGRSLADTYGFLYWILDAEVVSAN